MEKFDFSGWATKANLRCSDGRVIMKDAFKHNDGKTVPLVWNHQHNDPNEVLGHALLENREDGVYAYCKFNETESGKTAGLLVRHGDVSALSIYANQLKQQMSNVIHGNIREVSLVLAGANPGASIDSIIMHGEETPEEGILYTGEEITLIHADDSTKEEQDDMGDNNNTGEETVADVFNTLTDKQKEVVYAMIGSLEHSDDQEDTADANTDSDTNNEEGDDEMKHNIFEQDNKDQGEVLSHAAVETIINDAKRFGSMKESFMAHADEYGITNIDYLFPEARNVTDQPQFIQREMGWVQKVMSAVHNSPFSRIKSIFADITEDEARAKGYIKGNRKKEEVFSLLKRTTTPTTIYKKQKLDRDDIIDITDFDVVAWLKSEMRMMLDEELARAFLVGDGRLASSDDKINETNIRPIWKDEDLFTIKAEVKISAAASDDDKAREFIRTAIKSRKNYKGSGTPTLYTTEDVVTDCLLIEDLNKRRIYNSVADLATVLRVKEIITVEVMEGLTRNDGGTEYELMGIITNLTDYNVGADKGGAVNMFDDFDIDYNQQKYLIETRCSGALVKPFSAIALEKVTAAG